MVLLAQAAGLPEEGTILRTLSSTEIFFPASLLIVGVLLLIFGFKAHKWIVVINCVALGWWVGYTYGGQEQIATIGGILGAALLGVICWPLMKYAVALCGGIVGAVVGMHLWIQFDQPESHRWAGALIGLVLLGMLSFILFKASVILFTSIQGAAMAILGLAALLMRFSPNPIGAEVYSGLTTKPVLMPLLVFSIALLGVIYQQQKHGLLDGGAGGGGTAKPAEKK